MKKWQLGSYVRDGSQWIFTIKSSAVANMLKFRPYEEIREEQSTKIWKDQSIEVLFIVILQQCHVFNSQLKTYFAMTNLSLRACCYPRTCAHVPERNHLAPPVCWLMLVASLCLWSSAVKWNLACSSAGRSNVAAAVTTATSWPSMQKAKLCSHQLLAWLCTTQVNVCVSYLA